MPNQPRVGPFKRPPKGAPWREWPTQVEVPRRWGVTAYRVAAAVRKALISAYKDKRDPTGQARFNPVELDAHFGKPSPGRPPPKRPRSPAQSRAQALSRAAARAARDADRAAKRDDDDDDDDDDVQIQEQEPPQATVHALMRETLGMMRELRTEKVDALKHGLEPMRVGVDLLKDLIVQLRARITELETREREIAVEREELQSLKHLRDLELKKHESAEERRKVVIDMVKGYLPELVMAYVKSTAAPQDAIDFLASIDPAMLEALSTELEPEQRERLKGLEAMLQRLRKPPAQQKQEPQPTAAQNGVSTHG